MSTVTASITIHLLPKSILVRKAFHEHCFSFAWVSEVDTSFRMKKKKSFNDTPCAYFDGMYEYFNAHAQEFHAEAGMKWNGPCVHL